MQWGPLVRPHLRCHPAHHRGQTLHDSGGGYRPEITLPLFVLHGISVWHMLGGWVCVTTRWHIKTSGKLTVSFVLFMPQPQVGKKNRKLHFSVAELNLLKSFTNDKGIRDALQKMEHILYMVLAKNAYTHCLDACKRLMNYYCCCKCLQPPVFLCGDHIFITQESN